MLKSTLASFFVIALAALPIQAQDPKVIQIGIIDSLVEDISKDQRDFLVSEFNMLVLDFTGLKSKVALGGGPLMAAQKLEGGDWQFGVFQGVEFARAQAKYPMLKPLMIATYKGPTIRALLIVKKEGKVAGVEDLKGTEACMLDSKEHCKLFADKMAKGKASTFFSKFTKLRSVENALDDVLQGKVQAAFVDTAAAKIYEELNPGRYAKLRVLAESEVFPASVIAYQEGKLSDGLLSRWTKGMLKANKSEKGQEVMGNFRISSFELIPANYQDNLSSILKAYPPDEK